jgi:hypothetical protein
MMPIATAGCAINTSGAGAVVPTEVAMELMVVFPPGLHEGHGRLGERARAARANQSSGSRCPTLHPSCACRIVVRNEVDGRKRLVVGKGEFHGRADVVSPRLYLRYSGRAGVSPRYQRVRRPDQADT